MLYRRALTLFKADREDILNQVLYNSLFVILLYFILHTALVTKRQLA